MSKLFISIALLLIIAANQAAACDMGAIETWLQRPANATAARQNQLPKI